MSSFFFYLQIFDVSSPILYLPTQRTLLSASNYWDDCSLYEKEIWAGSSPNNLQCFKGVWPEHMRNWPLITFSSFKLKNWLYLVYFCSVTWNSCVKDIPCFSSKKNKIAGKVIAHLVYNWVASFLYFFQSFSLFFFFLPHNKEDFFTNAFWGCGFHVMFIAWCSC